MASNVSTSAIVADKMLEFFESEFKLAGICNRKFETTFAAHKHNIGQTIRVEKPPQFTAQDGPEITTTQGISRDTVEVAINVWKTVPVKITGKEKTFTAKSFDVYAEENLKPLVSPLANAVESSLFGLYDQVANFVGTPGTGPTTIGVIGQAREKLSHLATPDKDRLLFLDPTGSYKLATTTSTGLINFYNPASDVSDAIRTGKIPQLQGFTPFESSHVAAHLCGTNDGAGTVNGADQAGTSLIVANFTTNTFKKGDVIQIASVYSVHPRTKASTGLLRDFVVTANTTLSGGAGTLPISPAIITSGAFQNVSAGPADSAVVSVVSGYAGATYRQGLALWKDAIGLVTCPIEVPEGLTGVTRNHKGMSITLSKSADIYKFEGIYRADIVYGVVLYYQDQVCRVTN